MSALFFHEKMNAKKLIALALAFGSWFVSRPANMISKFAGSENLPLLLGFCVLAAVVVLNVRGKA